jgi:hypothetical protein
MFALGGKKPRRLIAGPLPFPKVPLPDEFDLMTDAPPGEIKDDQKTTGACVAFAWANVIMLWIAMRLGKWIHLSQEFIYDVGRSEHGCFGQAGMESIWGGEVLQKYGTSQWDLDKYQNTDYGKMPSAEAYADAKNQMALEIGQFASVEDGEQFVYQKKFAICMGIPVYTSFLDAPNGVIPWPGSNDKLQGYHELAIKGRILINGKRYIKFKNSWYIIPNVQPWGDKIYGYYPEDLLIQNMQEGEADMSFATEKVNPNPNPDPNPQPPPIDWKKVLEAIIKMLQDLGIIPKGVKLSWTS